MLIESPILRIPVLEGASKIHIQFTCGQELCHYLELELGTDENYTYLADIDLSPWLGQNLTVSGVSAEELLRWPRSQTGHFLPQSSRPLLHFTAPYGWLNDPNGLVQVDGTWHLFYQHNPFGKKWGNMTWGHATSTDLFQWDHDRDVLWPDTMGTMFSGGAIIDHNNTCGLGDGEIAPIVLFYTAAGEHALKRCLSTQCIAVSLDRGFTWAKYAGNPILPHVKAANRDPKVFWHETTQHWIMSLFLGYDPAHHLNDRTSFALFRSKNLLKWEEFQRLDMPGSGECPDLFELPLDDGEQRYWIFWSADGVYRLGHFDGMRFLPEGDSRSAYNGGAKDRQPLYAAQTWSDVSDGRVLQLPWIKADIDLTEANQQMGLPVELKLRTIAGRPTLCFDFPREFHQQFGVAQDQLTALLQMRQLELDAGAHYLCLRYQAKGDSQLHLRIADTDICLQLSKHFVSCGDHKAALEWEGDVVELDIVLDQHSIDLRANRGQVWSTQVITAPMKKTLLQLLELGEGTLLDFQVRTTIR